MKQIRNEHRVTRTADHLKKAGGSPALRAVCAQMDIQMTSGNHPDTESSKQGQALVRAMKTHVAYLAPDLQHVLAEEFEREVIAFRKKLEAKYADVKRCRDELANLNERRFAEIESLRAALEEVGAKVGKQARLIEHLKKEIVAERESRGQIEQRIRDARRDLTKVEHRLDDPLPESGGGA